MVLDLLRAIRADVRETRLDIKDIQHRLTSLETQVGGLTATETNHYAGLAMRFDRIAGDVDTIKVRIGLVEV